MTTLTHQEQQTTEELLQLNGTDYVEFYVGNARQASYFYRVAMGFSLVAYAGPETGQRDRASYVLQQGKIRFVLTTPLRPDNEIAEHIRLHGDGVRDVALWVLTVTVSKKGGIEFADGIAFYQPYLFVDAPQALLTGREVQGFPKEYSTVDMTRKDGYPGPMSVRTHVFPEFSPTT